MGGGFAYITFRRYTFVFVSGWYSLCIIICVIILSVISFTEIVDYCFVWNQFFYRIFRLSILYERGVFSVNPGSFASKSLSSKDVWQQDSIYHYKGLNICVLVDNRWRSRSVDCLLDIDYMYLCKGFKGKIAPLQKIFKIRKVILDASLGGYRLNLLKDECRGLGLDYIDISPKGSYHILL